MTRTIPLLLALVFAAGAAQATGPYRNPDNKNLSDPLEGTYPVPYKLPVPAEITAQLERVRGFIDQRLDDGGDGLLVLDHSHRLAGHDGTGLDVAFDHGAAEGARPIMFDL